MTDRASLAVIARVLAKHENGEHYEGYESTHRELAERIDDALRTPPPDHAAQFEALARMVEPRQCPRCNGTKRIHVTMPDGSVHEGRCGRCYARGEIAPVLSPNKCRLIAAALRGGEDGWVVTDEAAKSMGRIILCWRATETLPDHRELGYWKASENAWCNTYGRPFNGAPDFYFVMPESPRPLPPSPGAAGE